VGEQAARIPDPAGQGLEAGRQADGGQVAAQPGGVLGRAEPELRREVEGHHHADRHRLAVQQLAAVADLGLQGVAEGVAEVEQRPGAGLALVCGDDRRLGGAGDLDRAGQQFRGAVEDVGAVRLQPGEELRVVDRAVLHHLCVAGQQLAPRQGGQRRGVGEHQPRLVEGADQVLAFRRVDPGLAADRGVDLGEQGGRDLDEVEATQQDRRGEAGEVADHPAAQRDQRGAALDPGQQQAAAEVGEVGEVLARLAGRQHEGLVGDAGLVEGALQRLEVQLGDGLVGDDHRPRRRDQRRDPLPGARDQLLADNDLVAALAQRDGQRRLASSAVLAHPAAASSRRCAVRASSTRCTVTSGGASTLSTTMSAMA
jgi:hypothetical protein